MRVVLKKIGLDIRSVSTSGSKDRGRTFVKGGRIPWSPGYLQTRNHVISDVINYAGQLDIFRRGVDLPEGYGIGYDERCVELPWLFVNLPEENICVLDAGSAMNHEFLVTHPLLRGVKLHILTLFPEKRCFWQQGISYLYDDLRTIPIQDEYYDVIICISTLEHIGFNNSIYTGDTDYRENRPDDFILVIKELRRVLKPGGTLLLTLPFGVYQNLGWSQQFDRELLARAITTFDPHEVTETFYRYTSRGWQLSTAQACADSKYVEWIARAWLLGEMPDPIPVEPDRAAAARAVACVKLSKGQS
jgi:SAM-dependent methyltransferase